MHGKLFRVANMLLIFVLLPHFGVFANSQPTVAAAQGQLPGQGDDFLFLPMVIKDIPPKVLIPEGEFPMGCRDGSLECWMQSKPLHTVYLDAYYIDTTEVTNGRYAECVAAGACTEPWKKVSYSRTYYYIDPYFRDYPVIYVDWNQANAYCAWKGGRLPTEAEWEKAARGVTERTYPWGDQAPSCTLANYVFWQYPGCVGDTSQVGSYPDGASPYGVLDMAGNVYEWVSDWYSDTYYTQSPASNPTGPASGTSRVLRGSSWDAGTVFLVVYDRKFDVPAQNYDFVGFRCAYEPEE